MKTQAELQNRAQNESVWHEGTKIQATIVVQGWLRDGSSLWHAGDDVSGLFADGDAEQHSQSAELHVHAGQ